MPFLTNVKHVKASHCFKFCAYTKVLLIVYNGAWVAQQVKHLTSAQVMILRFMTSSPTSGELMPRIGWAWALLQVSSSPLWWALLLSLSPSSPHPRSLVTSLTLSLSKKKKRFIIGVPGRLSWLSAQLLISAQVMISRFMSSSPTWGSALREWSLLGILSLPLSLPPLHTLSLNKLLKN